MVMMAADISTLLRRGDCTAGDGSDGESSGPGALARGWNVDVRARPPRRDELWEAASRASRARSSRVRERRTGTGTEVAGRTVGLPPPPDSSAPGMQNGGPPLEVGITDGRDPRVATRPTRLRGAGQGPRRGAGGAGADLRHGDPVHGLLAAGRGRPQPVPAGERRGRRAGRRATRSSAPTRSGSSSCGAAEVLVDGGPEDGPPIEVLRRATDLGTVAPVDDLPPFAGGAVGYRRLRRGSLVERIPDSGRDEGGLPDAWFGLYDGVVALDRARQRLLLVALARIDGDPEAAWESAVRRLGTAPRGAPRPAATEPRPHTVPRPAGDPWQGWQATPSAEDYLAAVRRAREHILAGDIFQVVLSRRWRRMPRCTAAEIYRMLRLTNPSPYMFLFDTGQARILGSSPEMLVRVRGRRRWPPARSPAPAGAAATATRISGSRRSCSPTPRSGPST